jgi:hypothetical protein
MQDLSVSVATTEFLAEPVTAADPNLDVTTLPIWMAVLPEGVTPGSGDWQTAFWHTDGVTGETTARGLLGVALPLQTGVLVAWLKLDLGNEIPVRAFARLLVF